MKDYYTIQVMSIWPTVAVSIGGCILAISGPILIDFPIPDYTYAFCLVWVFAIMALGYFVLKKVATKNIQVALTAEELTIQLPRPTAEQVVKLDEIASFLYQEVNDNKTFRLRLHSGKKIQFGHNGTFCAPDDLPALVADFEKRIVDRTANTEQVLMPAIEREKTFFEKPIANVLGWIIVVALVGLTVHLLLNGVKDGKWGSLFMIYGNGLAYLGPWLNTRRGAQSK